MKIKRLMIAGAAVLLAGCAHAGGFSGKWVPVRGDQLMLIVTNLGSGRYSVIEKHQVPIWNTTRTGWRVWVVYEFTRHGNQLDGHVKQIPQAIVTLKHEGPGRLVFTSPDRGLFGPSIVFRRSR